MELDLLVADGVVAAFKGSEKVDDSVPHDSMKKELAMLKELMAR